MMIYIVIAFDTGERYADEYEIIGMAMDEESAKKIENAFKAKRYGYETEIRAYENGKMYDFIND